MFSQRVKRRDSEINEGNYREHAQCNIIVQVVFSIIFDWSGIFQNVNISNVKKPIVNSKPKWVNPLR